MNKVFLDILTKYASYICLIANSIKFAPQKLVKSIYLLLRILLDYLLQLQGQA